jgi:penicillin-binding protein 1A
VDGTYGNNQNVTVQDALARSLNTVSARIVNEKLKVEGSYEFLKESFGFTRLDSTNDQVLPSMAVGGMRNGFSTLEECAAYASIGNGGVYCEPFCYFRVLDSKGVPLLERSQAKKTAFSEGTAKVLNEMLRTVPLGPYVTGDNGKFMSSYKPFGKTGTTQDNKDRWFAGGTPYYAASVWFGYDTPRDLGQMANPAARIWMEVFNRIHKNLDPKKDYPKTSQAVQKPYCVRTGLLAGSGCAKTAKGWYKVNNTPKTCASCSASPVIEETAAAETTTRQPATSWVWQFLR